MKCRQFIGFVLVVVVLMVVLVVVIVDINCIDVYIMGDFNIINFWNNIIKLIYEKVYLSYKFNVVSVCNVIVLIVEWIFVVFGIVVDF